MNTQTLDDEVSQATRRLFRGTAVVNFILSSNDSGGSVSIIELDMLAGTEPMRHTHELEDETYIIEEGAVTFFIGNKLVLAGEGDVIFAPRKVPHHFRIEGASAKMLVIITPGAFDQFFWQLSTPYSAGKPLTPAGPPSEQSKTFIKNFSAEFGVEQA